MAFNSNGQITYFVLDSLTSGSKYGLEIIEYISQKTNGTYIMKKPSLYSCLTRMEKKGLVSSSFWGESELGGKRHYFSITDAGKQTLATLAPEFENMTYEAEEDEEKPAERVQYTNAALLEKAEQPSQTPAEEDQTVFLQQGNLFDMTKQPTQVDFDDEEDENDVAENQIDIFNMAPIAPENTLESLEEAQKQQAEETFEQIETIEEPAEIVADEIKDDAKLLGDDEKVELSQYQTEQNQILYNSSNDFKKYRKKKSFSENQIEMAVAYETEEDEQLQKDRIAELKRSLLEAKNNNFQQPFQPATPEEFVEEPAQQIQPTQAEMEEEKDDAVLITGRIDAHDVPGQKKIAPTNIEVNIYDDNLPAPNRNSNLEPTYKDMMAKLFERKREKQIKEDQPQSPVVETFEAQPVAGSFSNYEHLKQHYQNYGIEFKEHKKSTVERHHNTNLLQFITSAFLLLFVGISSAILYAIIATTGNIFDKTSFMFYALPAIFAVVTLFMLLKWKCFKSKKAVLLYNALANWAIFVLGTIVILIINVICGMQAENMVLYLTSLILPSIGLLFAFPINYHIKKFLYKKYAK